MNHEENKFVVIPLLFLALFSMMLMFGVSYTNASFEKQERPFPELFSPRQISPAFDEALTIIADNLHWSVTTAAAEIKEPMLAFFGLEGYKFGQPRYSSVSRVNPLEWDGKREGQVAGARVENPEYATTYDMEYYYR